jgi:hypothetical protein
MAPEVLAPAVVPLAVVVAVLAVSTEAGAAAVALASVVDVLVPAEEVSVVDLSALLQELRASMPAASKGRVKRFIRKGQKIV